MKNLLLTLILLLAIPAFSITYPVTDTFSGSGPLSSSWTGTTAANQGYVPLKQATGSVVPSVAGQQGLAIYTGGSFTNDQYSQVKFVSRGAGGSSTGPCVRANAAGDAVCYLADIGQIYLLLGGAGVGAIAGGCPNPAPGDVIELIVVGTTYTCSDLTTGISASGTNSVLTSGSPAILVDERTSTNYALAQFKADCTPTCNPGPPPDTISFTPPGATYTSAQMVAIATIIPNPMIFFTTDGSTPTTSSTPYTAPVNVASSQTIKAIAVASAAATYTLDLPIALAPQFDPPSGTYDSAQTVTLTTATPAATIHYTLDGSNPTTSSPIYTLPIPISASTTIEAIAVALNFAPSAIASSSYTIAGSTGGTTWYVNGGGGSRYSVNQTSGQCNGRSAAPYPGSGVNQNCAFNDIRYLWADGSYTTDPGAGAPAWGWIGASGDTYLIDCSNGASCRIGQSGPNVADTFGLYGNPYAAGAPSPIGGTPSAHTRILGINYQSCLTPEAKAHINGGYGVNSVFALFNATYVDIGCLDITDHSSCGIAGQANRCNGNYPFSDYALYAFQTNNKTTHTTFTDINIHGMASAGMFGPTGDGVALTRVSMLGNAGGGWNMDDHSGTTGTGRLTISYLNISWSGCAEEYPITHAVPYSDCTDDNSGGFGDGFSTATLTSDPAWIMTVDHSIAANNTQDGFDLLHLQGGGSSIIITNSLMYGNMGQQLKLGAAGTAANNLIVGNCNALRQAIPGIPDGYNAKLSDYCRAADVAVVMSVDDGGFKTRFLYNTLYSANTIGVEVEPNGSCTTTCFLDFINNIFVGFENNLENGYPSGGNHEFPTPIFFGGNQILSSPGSRYTSNATFNPRANWTCPQTSWNELNALCGDPGLVDETYHLYGFGNMSVASPGSAVVGKGTPLPGVPNDIQGNPRSPTTPTIGAYEGTASSSLPQSLPGRN
jgi:Chitobiase/beta-hexosaminidase C-terminal domain